MALSARDQKVLDAFVQQEPAEGRLLHSDGRFLYKFGLVLSPPWAVWRFDHVAVLGVSSVRSDDMVLRALRKRLNDNQIRTTYGQPPPLIIKETGDVWQSVGWSGLRQEKIPLLMGTILAWIPFQKKAPILAGSLTWLQQDKQVKPVQFSHHPELDAVDIERELMAYLTEQAKQRGLRVIRL